MTASDQVVYQPTPPRWWALHVTGELDLATGPHLDARLGRAAARRFGDGLVLDLSAVPFMDCAGLRPLLRAQERLPGRFCLRRPQPLVRRLLDLADVADILRILPDLEPWPAEVDPQRCGVILDDPFDHRLSRPVVTLARARASGPVRPVPKR
jgi:anti-anti-sigma factor